MYKFKVEERILSTNEEYAASNRELLAGKNKLCLNVISSPGSGKTTILARTIADLKGRMKVGVIEGDIQTDIDAQRIKAAGAKAIQINTDGACHLSAAQISKALKKLPIDKLDLLVIENVGNLICPSVFELGENCKIVVLSVAEGDDKCAKYPSTFARAAAILINKIDLLGTKHIDFNIKRVRKDIRKVNEDAQIFEVSAKTGQGMAEWYDWLAKSVGDPTSV